MPLDYYNRAIAMSGSKPYPLAHTSRSLSLLQLGQYAQGYASMNSRAGKHLMQRPNRLNLLHQNGKVNPCWQIDFDHCRTRSWR